MVEQIVIVKQGWLRGSVTENKLGGTFIIFNGIPFAEPPIGDLRFKDPQPPQPWAGIRDASNERPQCVQEDEFSRKIEGDEDCLYLNVATKSLKGSRPVMVWIHGGGFMWGNGGCRLYGPDYLVDKDIVYVSINYRLGVFGFLQVEHEAATGNMGLKDQVAALKWVKGNISQFGGDPNNITIFGESAGAASVHYHILSPMSKDLFHKAIAESGTAFNPWTCVFNTFDIARRLAAHLGKETADPNEIVEYLRTIPALKLGEAQLKILTPEEKDLYGLPFGPSVDSVSDRPFLPRPAYELVSEASDIPFMVGYNNNEGIVLVFGRTDDGDVHGLNKYFDAKLAHLKSNFIPSKVKDSMIEDIKKFYFEDGKITKEKYDQFVQFMGDYNFVLGVHELVDSRANFKSPTYLYRFSHDAPIKLAACISGNNYKGAGHSDELMYIFYQNKLSDFEFVKPGSVEQVISERFVRMWTDFAKTGNPTPQIDDVITENWEPVSKTVKNYLTIDADLKSGINPDDDMWKVWKCILNIANDQ